MFVMNLLASISDYQCTRQPSRISSKLLDSQSGVKLPPPPPSLLGRPDDAHGVPVGLVLEGHLHSELAKHE